MKYSITRFPIGLTREFTTGVAGGYRAQGPDSETLADCTRNFPYWFGSRLRDYAGKEDQLPFDQQLLKEVTDWWK